MAARSLGLYGHGFVNRNSLQVPNPGFAQVEVRLWRLIDR